MYCVLIDFFIQIIERKSQKKIIFYRRTNFLEFFQSNGSNEIRHNQRFSGAKAV